MKWKPSRERERERERGKRSAKQGGIGLALGIKTGIKCCLWERALHAQVEVEEKATSRVAPKNGQVTRSRLVAWVSDKEVRLRLNRCNYCNCAQRWQLGNFWNALQSAKRVATKTIRQDKFYGTPQLVCVSMCVCVCVRGHWPLVPFVGPSTLRIRDRHKLIRVARAFHFIFADAIAIESSFHMIESCLCVSFAPVTRSLPSPPLPIHA